MTDKTGAEKDLWDMLNLLRRNELGRLSHAEIEIMLADMAALGWHIVRKPASS
ncbi:hypothetical protein [Bradyrhizobium guangzhouense]|uniref:hypothetical protein n=1 Tax=Bradyrhizobium guangzhouense TaxID=1325095 RepID=UPI0013E89C8F|nr:hypothetical protein [Bradyrhizobium guangzhouense]